MKLFFLFFYYVSLSTAVKCQEIEYVSHTSVKPITSLLSGIYESYTRYQPSLKVKGGCVPFPAVGNYTASRGLKLGGKINRRCSSSPGQVYVRHMDFPKKHVRGIMYSYYFPKDQVFNFIPFVGHRHEWEEAVIWVTWDWKIPLGASMSFHDLYKTSRKHWNGSHYAVKYSRSGTHAFCSNQARDGSFDHPIANWDQLSNQVRYTLNNAVWLDRRGNEKATPKINDHNFKERMHTACKAFFRRDCN